MSVMCPDNFDIRMSHVLHMHASCLTYEQVMSHTGTSHVTGAKRFPTLE